MISANGGILCGSYSPNALGLGFDIIFQNKSEDDAFQPPVNIMITDSTGAAAHLVVKNDGAESTAH